MSLLFMDGMYYPTADILLKYSNTHENVAINSDTRRPGPGSLYLKSDIFPFGEVGYSFPVNADTMIAGFAYKYTGSPGGVNGEIKFYTSGGNIFQLRPQADFSVDLVGASTLTSTIPAVFSTGIWSYWEVKLRPGASGLFDFRINDLVVASFSGDTVYDDPITKVQWENDNGGYQNIQDLYICDGLGSVNNDYLGDSRVDIMRPTSAGSSTDFTPSAGSNWENVDEYAMDGDTTYNKSSQIGDKDSYSLNDISLTGGQIFGIQQQSVVRKDDASIRYGKQLLKSGTTEDVGDELQFNDTYTAYHRIFEEDPDTATTWDETGVNAIESGLTVTA